MLTFKKCSKQDLDTLYKIEEQMKSCPLYCTAADKSGFAKFMKEEIYFLILKDNEIAGYCSYKIKNKDLGEISGMAILEKFRHQGLGAAALEMMLKKLKNYKQIMLVTHPQNNNSLRLYLKFGFVIKEWKDNYFGNQPRLILYKENKQ